MTQKTTKQKKRAVSKKPKTPALTLIPSPIKQDQLLHILQKTPQDHVYRRPAKGGGQWEYITGTYAKKVLNYVFGWMWDFEIKDKGRENNLVWILGRLTIKNKAGNPMIIKEQFGRADIKFKRGTKEPLDYGNDLKAAATDALKKCASELGIASDIYGKNEFKQIQSVDKGFIPPKNGDQKIVEVKQAQSAQDKTSELKKMLKGTTNKQKIADLKKRTGIVLKHFNITIKHASILIATLLDVEVKK